MTSKQTPDSKSHNPEGHNQYSDHSKSGKDGKSAAGQDPKGASADSHTQSGKGSKSSSSGAGHDAKGAGSHSSGQSGHKNT